MGIPALARASPPIVSTSAESGDNWVAPPRILGRRRNRIVIASPGSAWGCSGHPAGGASTTLELTQNRYVKRRFLTIAAPRRES